MFEFYLSFIHANYDNQKSNIDNKTHVFTLFFGTPGARQKALQDASKMPSGRPKKRPRAPKTRSKRSRGLGCPHKAPKRLPRRPKEAPKRHPRGPQEALKALKIVAKRLTNQIRFSLSRNEKTVFAVVFDKAIGQQAADILKVLVGKLIKETDRKAGTWPSVDASGTTGCRMTGKSWHVRELKSGHSLPPILQASRRRPQFGPRRGARSVYNYKLTILTEAPLNK